MNKSLLNAKKPKVSIILLNLNQLEFTKNCISSIFKQSYKNFEIILVDNDSDINPTKEIKSLFPSVKIIRNKKNLGYAGGCISGYKKLSKTSKYVILINNDIIVERNWLKELVNRIEEADKPALVASMIKNKSGSKFVPDTNLTMNVIGNLVSVDELLKFPKSSIPTFFTAMFIFRKDAVPVLFDNSYFAYGEDMWLCWLLRMKGEKLYRNANSTIKHFGSQTANKMPLLKVYFSERNRIINLLTFYSAINLIKLSPLILLSMLSFNWFNPITLKGRLKAYFWCIFNFGAIMEKRRTIQKQRKISDKEITAYISSKFYSINNNSNFSLKLIISIINYITRVYCWLLMIPTLESNIKKIRNK